MDEVIVRSILSALGYYAPKISYVRLRVHLEHLGYNISLIHNDGWTARIDFKGDEIPYESPVSGTSTIASQEAIRYLIENDLLVRHVSTDNE